MLTSDPSDNRQVASDGPLTRLDETLTEKAERCRRLAAGISDRQAADVLRGMALQYENGALRVKG